MTATAALHVLYGGTFDPVHAGHLAIARAAHEALGVPVHLMPAADPPHRPPPGASAAQRVAMLALALATEPGLGLDLRELQRNGRSWSIDTLRHLRGEIGPQAPVALLVGAVGDRDDRLPAELEDALAGRMAASADELGQAPAGRVLWLRQPLHPHSATAIRARIAAGQPWRHLVPVPVADYIQAHDLYRGPSPPAAIVTGS